MEKRIQEGHFRLDLYYRIAGFVIHVPPLRERPLDILAIARKLAHDRGLELDAEAESQLLSYKWPGNVRELRSCMERATVIARAESAPRILAEHLVGLVNMSSPVVGGGSTRTLNELERQIIHLSLERNGWSRIAAAKELGIARSTLHAKMRRFGFQDEAMAKNQ
jgi:transcriptional regulator with GAF, ATPase, and Fis domain